MLRYKVLVLDHDDTVVRSTPEIHYPAFVMNMKIIRPSLYITCDDFFRACFDPGFYAYCRDVLDFTDEEEALQTKLWSEYVSTHIPRAFDGLKELLSRFVAEGGRIFVVSHSLKVNILRDYKKNELPAPEEVYGWERPLEERKPYPFPLEDIMRITGADHGEMLMVDDLKPGYDMAKAAGVDFACAGWGNDIPEIRAYMQNNCDRYLYDVSQLEELLFI